MPWSLNIGKVGGTEIRIHVTFLLFLAWIWAVTYMSGGANAAWSGLLFMVLLFLCVLVHEYGHILAARAFGVSTRDVTLLPIGGVARLERFPEEPREEFLIAIAGPMVNVAIVLALMLAGANPNPENLATADITKVSLIDRLAAVNIVLAVFNLIPPFPWTAAGCFARCSPGSMASCAPRRSLPILVSGAPLPSASSDCSSIRC